MKWNQEECLKNSNVLLIGESINEKNEFFQFLSDKNCSIQIINYISVNSKVLKKNQIDMIFVDYRNSSQTLSFLDHFKGYSLPIYFIINQNQFNLIKNGFEAGITDFVVSPVSGEMFYYQINKSLKIEKLLNNVKLTNKSTNFEENLKKIFSFAFKNSILSMGIAKEGKHVLVNSTYLKMFGYEHFDQIKNRNMFELIAPSERERITTYTKQRLQNQNVPLSYVTKGLRKNGKEFFMSTEVSQFKNQGTVYTLVFIKDITDYKNKQKEIEDLSERLKLAIKAGKIGIWEWDIKNDIVIWDESILPIYDIENKEYSPSHAIFKSLVHPDDFKSVEEDTQAALRLAKKFDREFRIVREDGSVRTIRGMAEVVLDENGNRERMIGVNWDITEQKKRQAKVEALSERLQLAIQAGKIGIWEWDFKTNIEFWDSSMFLIYGIKNKENKVSHVDFERFVHLDDIKGVNDDIQAAIKGDKKYNKSFRIIWEDGSIHHIQSIAEVYLDEEGVNERFVGVSWDITEQKLIEKDLKKNSIILNATSNAIINTDNQGNITFWNQGAEKLFGYQSAEIIGKPVNLLYYDEDHNSLREYTKKIAQEEKIEGLEISAIQKNKKTIETILSLSVIKDNNGEITDYVGISKDIHRRKMDRKKLQESEYRYRLLSELTNEGVAIHYKGLIYELNKTLSDMFGYTSDELLGTNPIDKMFTKESSILIRQNIEKKFTGEYLVTGIKKDGTEFFVNLEARNFTYMGLSVRVTTFRDVTEQKRIEDELFTYQEHLEDLIKERTQDLENSKEELSIAKDIAEAANKAKSTFLANMSHEIRTPMNAILGFANLLKKDENLNDEQKNKVKTIVRSGEHLLDLINDILEMSKIEAGRISLNQSTFILSNLLIDMENIFGYRAKAKNIDFSIQINSNCINKPLLSDENKLRQIFYNLLSNAIKFTDEGFVKLRVFLTKEENRFCKMNIEVEDSGVGILPNEIEKLFLPFEQTSIGTMKSEGTGLGLSICKEYIKLMNGKIEVNSESGKGSTFIVELPIEQSDVKEISDISRISQSVKLAPNQSEVKILVVDDNKDHRDLLSEILKKARFSIRTAENGQDSLGVVEEWEPNLILMDINMPEMDGIEAIKHIKRQEEKQKIAIVAVSASAFEENRKFYLEIGADDFIRKPIQEEVLFGTLERLLDIKYEYLDTYENLDTEFDKVHEFIPKEVSKQISVSLLFEVKESIIIGDTKQIHKLIVNLEKFDMEFAKYLKFLTNQYKYDIIIDIIDSLLDENDKDRL